jgi:hypothetical protein
MEKFQPKSHQVNPQGWSQLVASTIAGLVLSACGSTSQYRSEQPIQYIETPVYIAIPVPAVTPAPRLIKKTHTHNWPLWDKICTFLYNNNEKILHLCESKPAQITKKYSKKIPWETRYFPGKTDYSYKYGYGYNPVTWKTEYHYGPIPTNVPPKTEHIPAKIVNCVDLQPYNQDTWAAFPRQTSCL